MDNPLVFANRGVSLLNMPCTACIHQDANVVVFLFFKFMQRPEEELN